MVPQKEIESRLMGRPEAYDPAPLVEVPEDGPAFTETLGAAFRQQNSVASYLRRRELMQSTETPESAPDGFNPIVYAGEGYRDYWDDIGELETPEQVDGLLRQIDSERRDDEVLRDSGLTGMGAVFAAAAMDPVFWFTMAIPGGGATKAARFGRYAMQGAMSEAATEVALHSTQVTRTGMESAFNIGAAAFLSGVMGSAFGKMTPEEAQELQKLVDLDLGADMPARSVGAAERTGRELTPEESELTAGLDKFLKSTKAGRISPLTRMMTSRSSAARDSINRLAETPLFVAGNKRGAASHQAVETRVKAWQGDLAGGMKFMRQQFKEHKKAGGKLSYDEFRMEVGKAGRRGDAHVDPNVDAVAKQHRTIRDRIKTEAQENGLLPADVSPKFADSYINRVYNQDEIRQRYDEFVGLLEDWFSNFDELLPGEARLAAVDVTQQILGANANQVPRRFSIRLPSGTKERVLGISDEVIEPFLHSDASYLLHRQFDDMVPQIEIARAFDGDVQMTQAFDDIRAEYDGLIQKAKTPKAKDRLVKEMKRDIDDLDAMRKILTGEYGQSADPASAAVRMGKAALTWNYVRLLGGMTVSAMPDVARTIMRHGMSNSMRPLAQMLGDFSKVAKATAEMRRAGVGLDMVLNTRAKAMAELGGAASVSSRLGNYGQRATDAFSKVTLMAPWNSAMKTWAGLVTNDVVLRSAQSVLSGRGISKSTRMKLANLGLDDDMLKRIARQSAKHGDTAQGLKLSQTQLWDDIEAAEALNLAILKDTDIMIVTPGISDVPLIAKTLPGRLISQFKSFSFAATNRMLYSGLQANDLAFYNGLVLSVALGAVAHSIKSLNRPNGSLDTDLDSLIINGFDRSGVAGVFMEVNNLTEKFTGGRVGINGMFGQTPMSRYASRNFMEAAIGPTFGLGETTARFAAGVFGDGWTEQDTHAARKLMPYSNVFYYRRLVDAAEENINDAIGAK